MKKFLFTTAVLLTGFTSFSQAKKDWKSETLTRAGDHFMISLTSDHWSGAPDSISSRIRSTSRGLGISFMLDKPFKTDPHWSVAFGLGINGSNMFFRNTSINIKSTGTVLPFTNVDSADHFKKYKLVTVYAEIPIELRYVFTPQKEKSWKAAIGIKVGTLLNAHTKGKTLVNAAGTTINSYTLKESKKSFFNGNRIAATARVGIGSFTLIGSYQLTSLLKDVAGANINPYQIGLCISGL